MGRNRLPHPGAQGFLWTPRKMVSATAPLGEAMTETVLGEPRPQNSPTPMYLGWPLTLAGLCLECEQILLSLGTGSFRAQGPLASSGDGAMLAGHPRGTFRVLLTYQFISPHFLPLGP